MLLIVPAMLNVAVAVAGAVRVRAQVPVPVQAPLQPLNTLVAPGIAVSVTWVPDRNVAVHVPVLQLIPAGELVTVPVAVPAKVTDKETTAVKAAETEVAAFMVTTQVLVPEQAPLQPVKSAPVPAVAVSVT